MNQPPQSPLFHAQNAARYERQGIIKDYQAAHNCKLIVVVDQIWSYAVNVFEDLIFDADPSKDLHILLATPGGDGETAVRLVRAAQSRCKELTVIVPDQAKSAGTIFALGAHHILMGPTSDLGPIDPQISVGQAQPGELPPLAAAKDLIAAVASAEAAVQAAPDTYPLHASLLADVTALMVQQARSALARSEDILWEALTSNADREKTSAESLRNAVKARLIESPKNHGAICSAADAVAMGLPVVEADPFGDQWSMIWRLWMKYWSLDQRIYEAEFASQVAGVPRGF